MDSSQRYRAFVSQRARSPMNVCFTSGHEDADTELLRKANLHGLYGLKGHRVLCGLRASLYNAMPLQGVESLIDFLAKSSLT